MLFLRRSIVTPVAVLALLAVLVLSPLAGCGGGPTEDYDKPDAMMTSLRDAVVNDDPLLLWNALPTSWRTDMNGLVHTFGEKIDGPAYDALMRTARRIVTMLSDKKQFILNTPMLKMAMSQAGNDAKALTDNYDLIVTILKAMVDSDLGTAEGLKKADLGNIVKTYGPKVMRLVKQLVTLEVPGEPADFAQMRKFFAGAKDMTVTVESTDGKTAKVKVSMPALGDDTVTMDKVGDRWVPEQFAKEFPSSLSDAKKALQSADMEDMNKALLQAQMALPMINKAMEPLEKATTQDEFDAAVMQAMNSLMQMQQPGGG
ncbi:MAG: hypothetical protein MK116_11675 [Phycisphaerales bacterium]|nr:hypothetical protein [Phycisphaerales bacterium]